MKTQCRTIYSLQNCSSAETRPPSDQARHLTQLRRALAELVRQPKPRYPNEANSEYSLGILQSRIFDFTIAETHFAEACRLMPEIPLYRVHRAIALHELGREENAREQAAIALSLIRAHGLTATDEMQLLDRGLEHVQGPSRLWLSRELELNGKPPVAKNRQAAR